MQIEQKNTEKNVRLPLTHPHHNPLWAETTPHIQETQLLVFGIARVQITPLKRLPHHILFLR